LVPESMSRSRHWRALILTSGGNGTLAGLSVVTVVESGKARSHQAGGVS